MSFRRYSRVAALGVVLGSAGVRAADPDVLPAGGHGRHKPAPAAQAPAPVVPVNPSCPPGAGPSAGAPTPGTPAPVVPAPMPGTPGATPGTAPGTGGPATLPPLIGAAPNAGGTPGADASAQFASSLAQATQGGGDLEATALPQVFGDLLGGGALAGPLPVRVASTGQIVGRLPVVVTPNGQRVTLGQQQQPIVDEVLLLPAPPTRAQIAAGTTVGLLPPPGTVYAREFQDAVSRIPTFYRGAFKITENDTPRPTTRAYLTYNFYDQVLNTTSGPGTPRVMLHQQVFGYEQAFADRQFSVGIRLPYNQLVSPGFLNDTSLGDLTLISKAVLLEDRATGNLLSGGLALTVPSATGTFSSTLSGTTIRGTLIQPYLGYIYNVGDTFFQGFSSLVVPTDERDVTFVANDFAAGFFAYKNPGGVVSALIPVLELHVNNPLNHRDVRANPVGFADTVTVLGGLHAFVYEHAGVGFAAGSPVTGPRPFSLQATLQFNYRF